MPLTARERLIPIRVKIKRAKKHLAELETAANDYRDSYTHVAEPHQHLKCSAGGPKLRKLPIIHFDMLAIAGDVLQNLRSALDHVIYHLVLVANPKVSKADLREISFPIGRDLQSYRSLAGRKLKSLIEPRAMHFIDSLKPYKGGNYRLWRLHELNNIDKHRRLLAVGRDILCEGDGFEGHYLLKDNNPPFTRVDISKRQRNTKIKSYSTMMKLQAAQRKALIPTVREMVDFVDDLVGKFLPLLE